MRGQRAILFARPLAVVAAALVCALAGALPALAGGGNGNGNGSENSNGQGNAGHGPRHDAPAGAQGAAPGRSSDAPGRSAPRRSSSPGRAGGRPATRGAPPAQQRRPASSGAKAPRGGGSGRGAGSQGSGRGAGSQGSGRGRAATGSGGGSGGGSPSTAGRASGSPSRAGGGDTPGRGAASGRTRDRGEAIDRKTSRGGRSGSRGQGRAPAAGDGPGAAGGTGGPAAGGQGGGPQAGSGTGAPGAAAPVPGLVPLGDLAAGETQPATVQTLALTASPGSDSGGGVVLAPGEAFGVSAGGDVVPVPVGPVGLASDGPVRRVPDPRGARTDFSAEEPPGGPPVTRTVREIVEVVPGPVKAALALLALLAAGLGVRAAVTGARARRLERQRRELLAEVGLLQTALLPEVPDRLGELLSTVAYRPAEGPAAGGDFYDAFLFDGGRVGLVVGDVAGHGRDALARTALIRYTLRAYLDAGLEPRAALKVAGSVLDDDLGSDFATVVVAIFDPVAGTLTYAGAGHPPPILLGAAAHEPVTACSSPPLGAGATTGLRQTTVSLPAGSIACFFTDGLLEARVEGGLLGRERLVELLEGLGPDATAEQLLAAVVSAADAVPDDMAACVLRPAEGAAGKLRVEELEVAAPDLRGPSLERYLRACGIPMSDVPALVREAADTVAASGSAVLRVRLGDWRPGVDVLPGNVEVLVRTPRRAAGARSTS